jgi:hypothetical protein
MARNLRDTTESPLLGFKMREKNIKLYELFVKILTLICNKPYGMLISYFILSLKGLFLKQILLLHLLEWIVKLKNGIWHFGRNLCQRQLHFKRAV